MDVPHQLKLNTVHHIHATNIKPEFIGAVSELMGRAFIFGGGPFSDVDPGITLYKMLLRFGELAHVRL